MNASKEEAAKALEELENHAGRTGCLPENSKSLSKVKEFLEAAQRKLPSEAAYVREAKRRREKPF